MCPEQPKLVEAAEKPDSDSVADTCDDGSDGWVGGQPGCREEALTCRKREQGKGIGEAAEEEREEPGSRGPARPAPSDLSLIHI